MRGVAASNAGRCSDANAIISAATTYNGHSSGCGSSALSSSRNAAQGQPRLAPAHQRPPVEPVREHPAVEPEHDQRHQLGQPQRADHQRRPGQLLGLHQQRDLGRLRPQVHDGPAEEDRAERPRPRPPQRRRIRPQRRPAHGPSTSITSGRYQPRRSTSESFSGLASRAGTRDRAAIQPRVVGQIHPAVVNAAACNSQQRAVVDRLVVRDAVAQQVQVAHGIVNVPAHPPSPDSRERVAQAGQPQRAFVAAGEQEPPEPERQLGDDPARALRPPAGGGVPARVAQVAGGLRGEDPPPVGVPVGPPVRRRRPRSRAARASRSARRSPDRSAPPRTRPRSRCSARSAASPARGRRRRRPGTGRTARPRSAVPASAAHLASPPALRYAQPEDPGRPCPVRGYAAGVLTFPVTDLLIERIMERS